MKKYKNKTTNKIVIIIFNNAAGMCNKTLGSTMVIYKYEDDNSETPFVMEHNEFYINHSEITT